MTTPQNLTQQECIALLWTHNPAVFTHLDLLTLIEDYGDEADPRKLKQLMADAVTMLEAMREESFAAGAASVRGAQ